MRPSDEILRFLKDEEFGITRDVTVKPTKSLMDTGKGSFAVVSKAYEIEGLDPKNVTEPLVIEQDGRKYVFRNIDRQGNRVIAAEMEVR